MQNRANDETALIIIAEIKEKTLIDKAIKLAQKEYKKEFTANKEDFDKQLDTTLHSM